MQKQTINSAEKLIELGFAEQNEYNFYSIQESDKLYSN